MSIPSSIVTVAQVTAAVLSSFIFASASSRIAADRLPWWMRKMSSSPRFFAIWRSVAVTYSVSSLELEKTIDFLPFAQSYMNSYPASSSARGRLSCSSGRSFDWSKRVFWI